MRQLDNETIVAIATGRGGAISIIRVSGSKAISITDSIFSGSIADAAGYTIHLGEIEGVDQVLVSVFRAPHSYTGEDSVEISCHASPYIESRIVQLLIAAGARAATAGEFTLRAFLAGKLDLTRAEAVADLIASREKAAHRLAMDQMRGGVSSALGVLRAELVELAALLELELDFSEEDVQFASRDRLTALAQGVADEIEKLTASFTLGNAIREGVPVAIVGRPNAGKSTLLNALAGDDRAMVSEIAGTTRDRIEERVNIDGVGFRFIDTAGLRDTRDRLERMGIERTLDAIRGAFVVLLVVDAAQADDLDAQAAELGLREDQKLCVALNKIDSAGVPALPTRSLSVVPISARTGAGMEGLREWLTGAVGVEALESSAAIVSNARHYEALMHARESARRVLAGLGAGTHAADHETEAGTKTEAGTETGMEARMGKGMKAAYLSADLLAEELRGVLYHLGTITGEITTDELLGTIFSKFCIGK